ncbi:COMMD7 [Branchiostoma lanceolatum]|uniref:COMMD7 protein n=1 Tax=Branchiostoma lanceolatum TaxID=7740 RepID=A0A8K0EWJ9_BRALA|nr:COMMD7 [Branchiostoma lanceolatum]
MAAAKYHFTQEAPPDALLSDLQTLNKFQDEQFSQLISIVFSFLVEPSKSARMLQQLDEFAEHHGISAGPLKNVVKSLLSVLNGALRRNLTPALLKEDLTNLGVTEERAAYLESQWKSNLAALSRMAMGQTLMVNQLVDMEWKFGVTAASSEVQKVGNTFLQLKLVVNKGDRAENVYMELTLPQFYSFLHEMEKAKSSLEYFT